jgi:hypothetical protein
MNLASQIFSRTKLLSGPKSHNNTYMRGVTFKLLAVPLVAGALALAACSGSAVVTLTATPSSDPFIAYRVELTSVQLQTSGGKAGLMLVPTPMTVDVTKILELTEVLAAPTVATATYTGAVITLDYRTAQIIYDDGSLDGVALTPIDANGKALGLVAVSVALDPSNPLRSAAKQVGQLALDFNLAASNRVDLNAKTVTVTPLMTASTQPLDSKQVHIHGPILGANGTFFAAGMMPFDNSVSGLGQLAIEPSSTTTYEINGFVSTGTAGQAELAALPANTPVSAFGTLTASTATAGTTSAVSPPATTSSMSFSASNVLVDNSVPTFVSDRVSGTVTARVNNTVAIEDATWVSNGANTFVPGTTIVNIGANTLVTEFGQGIAQFFSPQLISVGSSIDAFGTATNNSTGGVFLDASTGRVRLDPSTAAGVVTAQSAGALTLNLATLGGRAVSALDFIGSGAAANAYGVAAGAIDVTNATLTSPVVASGMPNAFGLSVPNFVASTLLDPTTIQAELVLDWGTGTAAPFIAFDTSSIDVDVKNSSIGVRHQIQIGPQTVNLVGLSSDPLISPSTSAPIAFSIGHAVSSTVESFNSYAAFVAKLQSTLNGTTLATNMTAVGLYTASTRNFSATSITLFINN